jgi:hypothetical protein
VGTCRGLHPPQVLNITTMHPFLDENTSNSVPQATYAGSMAEGVPMRQVCVDHDKSSTHGCDAPTYACHGLLGLITGIH